MKFQIALILTLLTQSGPRKRNPGGLSECCQNFTLAQKMRWGFHLCSFLPTQASAIQPHYIEMSPQGVMLIKKASSYPGLHPIKDSSLVLAVGLGPKRGSQTCLWVLVRPCCIVMCWLPSQHLIFLYSAMRPPRLVSVQQTCEQFIAICAECN